MVSAEGRCELDVWPYLETLTSDVISLTAFGSSYTEGRKIYISTPKRTNWTSDASCTDSVPPRNEDDLLGMLLETNSNEIKQNRNMKLGTNVDEVFEECKLFYLAGQETTAHLLSRTMILLSQHPHWQEQEVLQAFGNEKPDHDGCNYLKVVNMILLETLRLYSPAAQLNRAIFEDMKVGEIFLPAGILIQVPIILLHHDKEIWGDDVKEFKPDRFAEGVFKVTKGKHVYFPFSSGPQVCIGQNFAMLEAKLAVAMILQRFSFELSPSYTHAPYNFLTLRPRYGVNLILKAL